MGNHRRIPEHVRLGVKPKDGGVSLMHDENGMPRTPRRQQRIPPPPDPVGSAPVRIPAQERGEPTSFAVPPLKRGPNAQSAQTDVRVQVGNHEESLWMDGVTGVPPQGRPAPQVIDNNDEVDLRAAEGTVNAEASMGFEQPAAMSGMQNIPIDNGPSQAPQTPQAQQSIDGIPEGAYGIVHDGELIAVSRNLTEIKQWVEEWVLNQRVPISSLTVFRNVPIGFGVILE